MVERKSSWSDWEEEDEESEISENVDHAEDCVSTFVPKQESDTMTEHSKHTSLIKQLRTDATHSWNTDPLCAWDFKELERELSCVTPTSETYELLDKVAEEPGSSHLLCLQMLRTLDETTIDRLSETKTRLSQWKSLANTIHWHLLQLELEIKSDDRLAEQCFMLERHLQQWISATPVTEISRVQSEHIKLQRALDIADSRNIDTFRRELEKIFERGPISISYKWLQNQSEHNDNLSSASSPRKVSYLEQQSKLHLESERINRLSISEIFQDSKDVQRDMVRVNEVLIIGADGYEVALQKVQSTIEQLIEQTELNLPKGSVSVETLAISREILHACNRTESGGVSFEIMSRFLTNSSIAHVLCRPDSASAEPIVIHIELCCSLEEQKEGHIQCFCFGISAQFAAVTWYSICKADGEMEELYRMLATYRNQLMFPCGLTPLYPKDQVQKRGAVVDLQLVCV